MSWFSDIIHKVFFKTSSEKMVREWAELFPGKCIICAFHRYGISHGFVKYGEPPPVHDHCVERNGPPPPRSE